jgi:hypothetical protein
MSRLRPTLSIAVWLIAFFFPIVDCARTEASFEYDLVEAFSSADAGAETSLIDIGSANSRPHLIDGWRQDERAGSMSFAWAIGQESSVRWLLTERRGLQMTFRCWPFPSSRRQTIDVLVNGKEIQRIELDPAARDYTVALPADRLVRGWNHTTFRYGFHRQKSSPIAVAWDWLRIEPLHDGEAPQVGSAAGVPSLVLPARAQLDYYVTIGAGTRLVADDIVANGDTDDATPLKVELQIAGSRDATTYALDGKGPYSVDLPVSSSTLARLSLLRTRRVGRCSGRGWCPTPTSGCRGAPRPRTATGFPQRAQTSSCTSLTLCAPTTSAVTAIQSRRLPTSTRSPRRRPCSSIPWRNRLGRERRSPPSSPG